MKTIENRLGYRTIESNLCYPSLQEYQWKCKLDEEYVNEQLEMHFNAQRINNKYAVLMPNGQIWYQHNGGTWLIEEVK